MDGKLKTIIASFRNNARENLTTASRKIRIPISTIYDKLRRLESSIITKYVTLLDFRALGYGLKLHTVLKVNPKYKDQVKGFLEHHPRINSVYAISNDYDYMVEVILKDIVEVTQFHTQLNQIGGIEEKKDFYIVEDIQKEAFYNNVETIPLVESPLLKK
jgi:DNA-binding Lrp family transcriptional regulator